MDRLELEVNPREAAGKGGARKLRARGFVPAVVYGRGFGTQALEVAARSIDAIMRRGTNQIIDLRGPDGFEDRLVLMKEVQADPVSRQVLHCDFYAVDTQQTIDVQVPVFVEGKPPGVEMGGILELVLREIDVKCLPLAIPEALRIDVSALEIGDALHVSDLVVPAEAEIMTDRSLTLVHVIAPRVEEEPVEEEGAEVAEGEAPAEGASEAGDDAADAPAEESSGD